VSNVGVVTSADKVLIGDSVADLERRITAVQGQDDRSKIFERLQGHEVDMSRAYPISYRPFDERVIYYDSDLLERSRENVMQHFIAGPNIGLVSARGTKNPLPDHFFVSTNIMETKYGESSTQSYLFPLYTYHDDGTRTANLDRRELAKLTAHITSDLSPEQVLDYIYGVLYGPAYREKYKDLLKADFPRVPIPANDAEFQKFASFGNQLRELHLMTSPSCDELLTTYPVDGSDEVEKPRFDEGRVWINAQQYFGGVPEIAWNFSIGGYQPAQKWLKDRKGRKLSNEEIVHYQKIITVLAATDAIMREIDA
jgi:predicted helicase